MSRSNYHSSATETQPDSLSYSSPPPHIPLGSLQCVRVQRQLRPREGFFYTWGGSEESREISRQHPGLMSCKKVSLGCQINYRKFNCTLPKKNSCCLIWPRSCLCCLIISSFILDVHPSVFLGTWLCFWAQEQIQATSGRTPLSPCSTFCPKVWIWTEAAAQPEWLITSASKYNHCMSTPVILPAPTLLMLCCPRFNHLHLGGMVGNALCKIQVSVVFMWV